MLGPYCVLLLSACYKLQSFMLFSSMACEFAGLFGVKTCRLPVLLACQKGLAITPGAHIRPGASVLPRPIRVCTHCGGVAVADEMHIIFDCPALRALRQQYAPLFSTNFDAMQCCFAQQDHMQVFKFILSCLDVLQIHSFHRAGAAHPHLPHRVRAPPHLEFGKSSVWVRHSAINGTWLAYTAATST